MAPLCHPQGGCQSKTGRNRMETMLPIEIVVLRRINNIKTGNPKSNGRAKPQRGEANLFCHRNPDGDWCNPQTEPQPKMGEPSESFGKGISEHNEEGHRAQMK